ncbi:MAG: prolyl oligopeptidase family protein [Hyphomonadaceae bacterium]
MTMKADPYLWLEEVEGPRALDWVRAENARSLGVLEADARYPQLLADARQIATSHDRLALGAIRGGWLYNFWQDETHVRGLWRRAPLDAYQRNAPRWEILLDLDAAAAAAGANWVWKGVSCAPSNARCMVQLSDGGKDASIFREFDLTTKTFVADGFFLPEAKASVEYAGEDTLIVATDWGPGSLTASGYPRIVKIWRRGAPLAGAEQVLEAPATDMGVFVSAYDDVDGRRTIVAQQMETFFEGVQWRIAPGAAPERLTLPRKATLRGAHKGHLIVTIEEAWTPQGGTALPQGALIAIDALTAATAEPRVQMLAAPGPRDSIEEVETTHDAVLVAGYHNVRGRISRFAFDGQAWRESAVALPPNGAAHFAGASSDSATAFAVFTDFLTPSTLYALTPDGSANVVRALPAQFDASPYVSEQFEAVSKDGTRVPYFVVRRRDLQLNGQNPTLLYGYGGFQISLTPAYSANVGKLWLDHGGTYVLANIRGGGEFGPAWHQAGLRTHRQVVYDDFIAVAEDLIARRITGPRRLGIQGGSNGGLLMGVMLNQRPDLFHAALIEVPLLDMLRYDQLLAGASWVDEYGSPSDPEERRWLERMSPYQNLRRRPDYPLPFLVTSTKDDRVHPGHARKYAARLEELGMPFLYYENIEGGHSAAANELEAARRRALEYAYLMQRLMD